jgi:hypothetical protein
MSPGRFSIDPDPPVAGQPAKITYTGRATEVTWQVDGQPPVKVEVPPRTILIPSVPSGEDLVASDKTGGREGSEAWPIDETASDK